jgi:hypothetical protein
MKLDLILENQRSKYTLGLLEESSLTEKEVLKGKMLINEATMNLRAVLVGGVLADAREVLTEAWTSAILEESVKAKMQAAGKKSCFN